MQLPSHPWSFTSEELAELFHTSLEKGLSAKEASDRLIRFGKNQLPEDPTHGPVRVFLKQLRDPLIYILCFAGVLTFLLQEWAEVIFIIAAILANATMGFWQEWKAQSILDALKNYIVAKARVRRDGIETMRDATDLVTGDIVLVRAGDRIPADIRITKENGLKVDEAILTGESLPVDKTTDIIPKDSPVHERSNILMSGTLVAEGTAEGVVVATGAQTVFGSIAALTTQTASTETPLQKAIEKLSLKIGVVALIATLLVFIIGVQTGATWSAMILLAIAIGVSLVPEGLPIALSVILAIGVERLAKQKGVVRRLASAEALGSTTLILTDKTGTLTEARLRLTTIHSERDEEVFHLARFASTANIENPDQLPERWRIMGSPVDTAILRAIGLRMPELMTQSTSTRVIERVPFDHARKFAITLIQEQAQRTMILLGAPDYLSRYCKDAPTEATLASYASKGARLIGLCTIPTQDTSIQIPEATQQGSYVGTLAFEDPLRPGITESVREITNAGVRTIMVTGDHPETAHAIAQRAGIATQTTTVLTGTELESLDDTTLKTQIHRYHAYARVTPEQKWRLVKAYQDLGEAVAVTGDGVNDAPALRLANVGVAMGSGTDVAKEAADIVILDDAYSTIVSAIHGGRVILNNIQKATTYLFANAFNDLVLVLGSFALGLPSPLNALQILYANFFTDSFPAIGYAFESLEDEGTHQRAPQKHDDVLGPRLRKMTILSATCNAMILLGGYWYARQLFGDHAARTIGFASMGLSHIFVATCFRSLYLPVTRFGLRGNKVFLAGISIGVFLIACALYIPWLNHVLDTTPLNITEWAYFVILALIASVPAEMSKFLFKARN